MADAVGTAFVEIRPDLRGFEAELSAALRTAVRNITPPTAGLTKGATAQTALGTATRRTTKALSEQAVVMQVNSTELARFSRGAAATTLAQFGLRGATLAATSSFLAGAAAITALAKAVGLATSFNSQLAVFGATTGATAAQMQEVSDAAKALGRDLSLPGVTAVDAAVAMTELAKAGLSVQDAIAGARGVLQLAGAAGIDFAQATQLAASAINAFALSGDRAVVVADTLANAANAAQGSIVDVGIAFQQAAAIGHQVGLSFQDTTLFITELARAGLTGSDAGTSLRTALIRLINPTEKARKIFKELGIEVRDAQGNLRPEFFTNLGIALSKMSKQQRDATLAVIGGQDAIRALSILSRASTKDVLALRASLDEQGTAAKVNQARMVGLAGAGANLSNTIESLALNVGQKATPSLIGATNALTGFIQATAASNVTALLGESLHVVSDAVRDLAAAIQFVLPVIGTFVSIQADIAHAIGPTAILAGVAAYLVLGRALSVTIPRLTLFVQGLLEARAAQAAYAAAAAGAGIETAGFGATLLAAVNPMALLTIGTAAAVAGLVFLATRESEAEKATKNLASATSDLAQALQDAAIQHDALSRAQSSLRTDKIALDTAKLAVEQARSALAASRAGKGTFERRQLENRLAFALDTVRRQEEQLSQDRKDVASATKDANAADATRFDSLKNEAEATKRLAREIETAHVSRQRGLIDADLEKKSVQDVIDKLNARAAAERKLTGEQHRATAERLAAIAQLAGKVRDLPLTIDLVFQAKDLDTGLRRVEDNLRVTGQTAAANFVEGLRLKLNPSAIGQVLGDLPGVFRQIGRDSGNQFGQSIVAAVESAMALVNRLVLAGATRLTIQLSNQTDTLLQNVQRTELTGGTLDQQLSAARAARARAERELAAADAAVRATGGRSKAAKERQTKALQDLASAQADVDRIQGQIASEAKDAAAVRQKKIDDAQKARDAADQAFLTLMGELQGPIDLAVTRAGLTKSLQDDIAAQLDLQNFLRREIAQANRTIQDVHLRIQTVAQLTTALVQSQITTKQLIEQQREAAKQAIIDRRDRQQESLELDVQIAETTKNRAKELKAHQALLRFLEERRKHTSRGSVEWKRLTLEIAQERAAIAELRKANRQRADELHKLEFEFLQTQTGFVANLLGNLLPIGAVAGTVGGGAVSTTTPTVPAAGFATAVHQRPTVIPEADFATNVHRRNRVNAGVQGAAASGATAGASFGQMSVLITIARAQLAVLQAVTGKRSHPEANVQRAAQHASMDTLPF